MLLRAIVLAAVTATMPAHAAEESLSPAQKSGVERIVRDYIKAHPELIVEALQEAQERERLAQEARTRSNLTARRDDLADDPDAPWAGNPDGDVTIVEFFDYRCGYCKRVFPTIMDYVKDDGNIRYVFKEFPILGPESVEAARAALAAWRMAPETYMPFHGAMMAHKGTLTEGKIARFARAQGLDVEALKKEMRSPEVDALLERNYDVARALDIRGTPAFVIGERIIPGAASLHTFEEAVAAARAGRS